MVTILPGQAPYRDLSPDRVSVDPRRVRRGRWKTSCAVTYAHGEADYNGHYGIRELCDICPMSQLTVCANAWKKPDLDTVTSQARLLGATSDPVITDRAVIVEGLNEPPRYWLQHTHGYQVHDASKPHHHRRHGRADIGWRKAKEEQ
ncbi:hypothetical protein ACFVWG_12530 [Kribbella sp. NPDC058245]|uniref:hypothetical protein n=1 Tax=Kribbella sp. NPDC058245 TaxID=3346399 RepID=UPI0036EFDEBB